MQVSIEHVMWIIAGLAIAGLVITSLFSWIPKLIYTKDFSVYDVHAYYDGSKVHIFALVLLINMKNLNILFSKILAVFPELSKYNIKFETYRSQVGFSTGEARKVGDSFVIRIATNLIKDDVEASFVIAHELSHILINSHNIPRKDEERKPKDILEALEWAIEDVVCDWLALKRLERLYSNDEGRLRRLYEVYLDTVGVAGYVALAEDFKEKVLQILKEKHYNQLQRVLKEYFAGIPIEDLDKLSFFTTLGIAKYLSTLSSNV
ncbi:MAG: hypothetical protein J7J99_00955 [Thermoprotei archaeon]|nr:hypothetical protein [Thermoprotei archaeon]